MNIILLVNKNLFQTLEGVESVNSTLTITVEESEKMPCILKIHLQFTTAGSKRFRPEAQQSDLIDGIRFILV